MRLKDRVAVLFATHFGLATMARTQGALWVFTEPVRGVTAHLPQVSSRFVLKAICAATAGAVAPLGEGILRCPASSLRFPADARLLLEFGPLGLVTLLRLAVGLHNCRPNFESDVLSGTRAKIFCIDAHAITFHAITTSATKVVNRRDLGTVEWTDISRSCLPAGAPLLCRRGGGRRAIPAEARVREALRSGVDRGADRDPDHSSPIQGRARRARRSFRGTSVTRRSSPARDRRTLRCRE